MTIARQGEGGTVLRGADGSLYFVRDGLLDALRVEGEGLERLQRLLADTGEPGAKPAGDRAGIERLQYVKGDLKAEYGDEPEAEAEAARQPDEVVASTVMCPWFC